MYSHCRTENAAAQLQAVERCFEEISQIRAHFAPKRPPQNLRYAAVHNQIKRISRQCGIPVEVKGSTQPPDGISWSFKAECFSVLIVAIPKDGYCIPPGTMATGDIPIRIVSVKFDFDQVKPTIQECPSLVDDLNNRVYNALLHHLKNLVSLYALPEEPSERRRAYMILESLEYDVCELCKAVSTSRPRLVSPEALLRGRDHSVDTETLAQLINGSAVGQFVPREGGKFGTLTYFVTPHQRATWRPGKIPRHDPRSAGLLGGYCATVGLRGTGANGTPNALPIFNVVNLVEDSEGYHVAQFTTAENITRVTVNAEFFLKLHPPLLVDVDSVAEIEAITRIPLDRLKQTEPTSLRLLLLREHDQEGLEPLETRIETPLRAQHVFRTYADALRGYLLEEVAFSCPSQLPPLIELLRSKAAWLSFAETFMLYPEKPIVKFEDLTYRFRVYMRSMKKLQVSFVHPLWSTRKVKLVIEIGPTGVSYAKVSGSIVPELQDEVDFEKEPNPTKILAESLNMSVGLIWLMIKIGCPVNALLRDFHVKLSQQKTPMEVDEEPAKASETAPFVAYEALRRAMASVTLSSDAAADGIVSGADRLSQENLAEAKRLFIGDESAARTPYDPTVGVTANWPVPSHQSMLPPGVMATTPPQPPSQSMGVMGIPPEQIGTASTPRSVDDAFSPSTHSAGGQGFRQIPMIPGVMTTQTTAALFSQPGMRPLPGLPQQQAVAPPAPSGHAAYRPPTSSSSCGSSMLGSLLDEENPPQGLAPPPPPTLTVPPTGGRVLAPSSGPLLSPPPSSSASANAAASAALAFNQQTAPIAGPSSSSAKTSDVLSHLLISGPASTSTATTPSSSKSITESLSTTPTATPSSSKKARKRRSDAITVAGLNSFVSTLPLRAEAAKHGLGKPAAVAALAKPVVSGKESVYDFEDCPPAASMVTAVPTAAAVAPANTAQISPALSSSSAPQRPSFTFADSASAEKKASLKFVIKTNRGATTPSEVSTPGLGGAGGGVGSGGGVMGSSGLSTSSSSTSSLGPASIKPRSKEIEGKPAYLIKPIKSDSSLSTPQLPPVVAAAAASKKERKKRVSNKAKEAYKMASASSLPPQQSPLVLSISPSKIPVSAASAATPVVKKHALVKPAKPGRKKGSLGEGRKHRMVTGVLEPSTSGSNLSPLGESGSAAATGASASLAAVGSTNRLMKGYRIPKKRQTSPGPSIAATAGGGAQEELASANPQPSAPQQTASVSPNSGRTGVGQQQPKNLLAIVEELKRTKQQQQQGQGGQPTSESGSGGVGGVGDESSGSAAVADPSDNLFEKFAGPSSSGMQPLLAPPISKRFKNSSGSLFESGDGGATTSVRSLEEKTTAVSATAVGDTAEPMAQDPVAATDNGNQDDEPFVLDSQTDLQNSSEASNAELLIKDTPDSPTEATAGQVVPTSSKIIPVSQEPPPPSSGGVGGHSGGGFFGKSIMPGGGRPNLPGGGGRGGRGGAGPRYSYMRGGWNVRSFGSPGMPLRGAGNNAGGGPGYPPWGAGGPPPPLPGGGGGGGSWGPPRGGGPPPFPMGGVHFGGPPGSGGPPPGANPPAPPR